MTVTAAQIAELVNIASDTETLDRVEALAAVAIRPLEIYPANSCAIPQYELLKQVGIDLGPPIFLALAFVDALVKLGWKEIPAADVRSGKTKLEPGDIGTTCYGGIRHPGVDHVYLVLKPLSEDENLIADNQSRTPHFRYIDGTGGKSPTQPFLRPPV